MRPTSNRGQGLVELALALPMMLVLIFGAVEFGTAMYDKAVVTNASREGARAGIVATTPRLNDRGIQDVVSRYSKTHLLNYKTGITDTAVTTITPALSARTSGALMTVTVTYSYRSFLLPKFVQGLSGGFGLSASTVMRME
jgi:Flp pilus assembly protein TadG